MEGIQWSKKVYNEVEALKFKDAIEIDTVINRTYEGVHKDWEEAVDVFKQESINSSTVILYKLENDADYSDGSGVGFMFNWGVFNEVKLVYKNGDEKTKWNFVRGARESKDIIDAWHQNIISEDDYAKWNRVLWSEAAEDFFRKITTEIVNARERIRHFVDSDITELGIETSQNLLKN